MAFKPVTALLATAAIAALVPATASAGTYGITRLVAVTQMKSNNANDQAMRSRSHGTVATTATKPSTAQRMGLASATKDIASAPRSGAEISMIELQSLVSKRGTAVQLTTGMMNATRPCKECLKNIGR